MGLELLDWRRRVGLLYAAVRADPDSAHAHQRMADGQLPEGNVAVLINSPTAGLTDLPV